MIIKIHKAGRSFAGVCRYLTHDPKAETAERVAWTHTLNLANDDVPSAVDEMLWTFRSADLLKREAGVATGGSKLEKPVRHFSLSWAHGETPSKEHIIETVRAYMEHMGYSDRQAVLVAHNDTRHAHAHVVMNSVSPVDGRAARSSHDWRRSEAFALEYERAQDRIHCEQRLRPRDARDPTPTRESWQRFKRSEVAFDRAEIERLTKAPGYFERHDEKRMNGREWEALKAWQKQQRQQFFIDGKQAYRAARNEAFREVREEFRAQWSAYYTAQRHGHDRASLAETKVALLAAQNRALDERRKMACDALRETRDQAYDAVLAQQRFDRAELGRRQQQGLRTYPLLDVIYPAPEPTTRDSSHEAARSAWQSGTGNHSAIDKEFERSGRLMIDPFASGDGRTRHPPGVIQRGNERAPAQATDGFGRSQSEAKPPTDRIGRGEHARAEAPRRARAEMGDAAWEKVRAEKAQEMTDQRAARTQVGEAAALRASWNRRRRTGGRGD